MTEHLTDVKEATAKVQLCGHCQLPIHPSDSRRHFGFYVAHGDGRCVQLLQMEIERLRTALTGISTCSTCEACRGAARLALTPPPGDGRVAETTGDGAK